MVRRVVLVHVIGVRISDGHPHFQEKYMWRLWCKALGEKATHCSKESDKVAIIRTVVLATYLITNIFIVAGVIRHWNDDGNSAELQIEVEVQDK